MSKGVARSKAKLLTLYEPSNELLVSEWNSLATTY